MILFILYRGERVWKHVGEVQQMWINMDEMVDFAELTEITLYANPYMVINSNGYTKHYYTEGQRVCSKIGGGFTDNPVNLHYSLNPIEGNNSYEISKGLTEMIRRNSECVEFSPDYVQINNTDFDQVIKNLEESKDNETDLYFYHSDHIGSASFVTDANGISTQHLQYLPFGETFVDQRNGYSSRYTFSAKEKDIETGYSYFGARYYLSEFSFWPSVDPMADKYPNMSPYAYCNWNPIKFIDPDGMQHYIVDENGKISPVKGQADNDKFDMLYKKSDYKNGKLDNGIKINDQNILPELINKRSNYNGNYGTTSSVEDAYSIYKFVSENTSVEWNIKGYKTKSGNEYLINTSHEKGAVNNTNGKYNPLDLFIDIHTHWKKTDLPIASGYEGIFDDGGDWNSVNIEYNNFKTANKKYPDEYPKFYTYHVNTKRLYQYTPTNSSIPGKKIRTSKDFYRK